MRCKPGDWVVQTRGRYAGRIGLVTEHVKGKPSSVIVQFGADGPSDNYLTTSLRLATREEIAEKTGEPYHPGRTRRA